MVLVLLSVILSVPSSASATETVQDVLSRDYQTKLPPLAPVEETGGGVAGGGDGEWRGDGTTQMETRPQASKPRRAEKRSFIRDMPILAALMWTGILIAVVLLVAWVVRYMRKPAADVTVPEVIEVPEDPVPRNVDPDELARAGKFGLAIHALLINAFTHIAQSAAYQLPVSFTSREVVSRLPLLGPNRDLLLALVHATDRHLFAGTALTSQDYLVCRDHYVKLVGEGT